jgi:TPR repeat protein
MLVEAKVYWQKAADLWLSVAQINLARLHVEESRHLEMAIRKNGDMPVKQTFLEIILLKQQAFNLLILACQKDHPGAWKELGTLCDEGLSGLAPGCFILSSRN